MKKILQIDVKQRILPTDVKQRIEKIYTGTAWTTL